MHETVIRFLRMAELELHHAGKGGTPNPKKLLGMLEDFSEDFVEALGLVQLGKVGDVVAFDPEQHESDEPLAPGQEVTIRRSGWVGHCQPYVSALRAQ